MSSNTEDISTVGSLFKALANKDLAAAADVFHDDATWNHRNNDRHGGVHRGSDGIMACLGEATQLTAGTLKAVPQSIMADGAGRVCAVVRLSASRPDGRSMDGPQIALFTVDDGRVRAVDQFVGDPDAAREFWA